MGWRDERVQRDGRGDATASQHHPTSQRLLVMHSCRADEKGINEQKTGEEKGRGGGGGDERGRAER